MATDSISDSAYPDNPHSDNWRDIPTHLVEGLWALNRVIAKRLGYYVVVHTESKVEQYQLIAPHERAYTVDDYEYLRQLGGEYAKRLSANAAWRDAFHYTEDAESALGLVEKQPVHFELSYSPHRMNWRAEINGDKASKFRDANTPALAICLAWLAYTDAQARQQKGGAE